MSYWKCQKGSMVLFWQTFTQPILNLHTLYPNNTAWFPPICEYHLKPKLDREIPKDVKYKIQVPHIVEDIEKAQDNIQVWHGNLHSGIPMKMAYADDKVQHTIDEKFVNIYTSHFSGFIVSVDCIKCCGSSAEIHLFGSLRNIPKAKPLTTVKICLTSNHSRIKDYRAVSID